MNALTVALKEELNVEMISSASAGAGIRGGQLGHHAVSGHRLHPAHPELMVDHISRRQAILEMVVTTIDGFFTGLLGEQGRCYVPYLMTVAIYIACSNLIGVFGVKPPTKDLNGMPLRWP